MPPRRKKRDTGKVEADVLKRGVAARRNAAPRYHMVPYPDGTMRPERSVRRTDAERNQAWEDWLGAAPALSERANVRSMDSLLSEVLENMHLETATQAPEVLAAAWERAVGAFLVTQAELVSVSKGTARIRAGHPAVRFELGRRKPQIMRVLNAELGEGSVKAVRIVSA